MNDSQQIESLYFEKKNIPILTISEVKKLILTHITNTLSLYQNPTEEKDEIPVDAKQAFHLIGPAGVGKTSITHQLIDEIEKETNIKFDFIMIKSPVLSRDDFLIPYPVKSEKGIVSFDMLKSNFIPKNNQAFGLFIIDEFSRGDHSVQQLLWQIQNECAIHDYKFPNGWFIISTDNPDDSQYTMDVMEDAAGLRRQLHIYIKVSVKDFLEYAIKQKYHPLVIGFIQANNDKLYDWTAQKIGQVFSNPASWEKVSNHLKGYGHKDNILKELRSIEAICGGLLNTSMARIFIQYIRDILNSKDSSLITPVDIFENYKKVKPKIDILIKEENNAKLSSVLESFMIFLTTFRPDYTDKELKNISLFLTDLPVDASSLFFTILDTYTRGDVDYMYMTGIQRELMKNPEMFPEYREFYNQASVMSGSIKYD